MVEETFDVDGKTYGYGGNPYTGEVIIELLTGDKIQLEGKPTKEEMAFAVRGYLQGLQYGKHLGAAILKNDFKRLMGLFD